VNDVTGEAPPFNLVFNIGFNKTWDEGFSDDNCPPSPDCQNFKKDVEKEVRNDEISYSIIYTLSYRQSILTLS